MAFGVRTLHCSHVPSGHVLGCGSLRKEESVGDRSYAIVGAAIDCAPSVESKSL